MQQLAPGRFYGQTNKLFQFNALTLTDTEYTHDKVDWHYHENAYFTFILAGRVLEGSKCQVHHCEAGTLLFHHCQEPHYNLKPPGFTRGFHVEINPAWFAALDLNPLAVQGSVQVKDPTVVNSIDAGVFKAITSVVVIKNGTLLIEEYFNGATRQTLHDPRSVGKSFASTLCGIAVGDGYLKGQAQPLSEFYDLRQFGHYMPAKGRITVGDLLTMRSAFAGNDEDSDSPGNEENMYPTEDWVKFALSLPLDSAKPRGKWEYFTGGAVLLGDIVQQRVPGGLEAYADQKLFRPLGITTYKRQYTPQHVPNTAGSLQLSALDFAKYGQLYKNGGLWQGQRVLPAAWVTKTLTRQVALPDRANEFYGYLFWNKTYQVQGNGYETFYCAGNGGNKIYVFKDQPLVVVVTATAYGATYAHRQVDRMMTDFILPAVVDAGTRQPSGSIQPPRPSAKRPGQ